MQHEYGGLLRRSNAFGLALKEIRAEKEVSQDKLAILAEFDRTYPSLLERGKRTPTLAMLFRLSEALNVPESEFISRTKTNLLRFILTE